MDSTALHYTKPPPLPALQNQLHLVRTKTILVDTSRDSGTSRRGTTMHGVLRKAKFPSISLWMWCRIFYYIQIQMEFCEWSFERWRSPTCGHQLHLTSVQLYILSRKWRDELPVAPWGGAFLYIQVNVSIYVYIPSQVASDTPTQLLTDLLPFEW